MKKGRAFVWAVVAVVLIIGAFFAGDRRRDYIDNVREELIWSIGVYKGDTPFSLKDPPDIRNPVLTYKDVTDRNALFVADPFLVREGDRWYLFLEVALADPYGKGVLAVATSEDGQKWTYDRVVLEEPFHLSYPQVFKWEGEYYLIPESWQKSSARLYHATEFPYKWEYVKTIIPTQMVDPSLFRQDDVWYLIGATDYEQWDTTRLYFAESLTGPWKEHPMSPIVQGDANMSRPGGRMLQMDGSWYRIAQDCLPTYGNQVLAFRITELSPTRYAEEPVDENPVLAPSGEWWTTMGMHQIDALPLEGGGWISTVDGQAYQKYRFRR